MRLPFFVWAQFVTAFLLLLAFPPLEAAVVMQLMDRIAGTSFFMPTGLVVNGAPVQISGGGSPLLWQHLFWFLGHPEVYVLILPGMGIVAEIIANNTRKPLWGYKSLVFAALVLGFLSFIVWAHHMWLTGMGSVVSAFFQTTTMIISIPSVIILSAFFISLWGGSIRFNVPMLFATAFLPMFGIGGLTGIPLAFNSADLYLHDTYYVIAHFHYIVAPGTIFAVFAGIYFWFPKATGRRMNEFWGKVHFWPSLICMNVIFLPMFLQGMLGMHRRWYDGGQGWTLASEKVWGLSGFEWNTPISIAAWVMGLAQIPFIINFFWSIKHGEKVNDNPWEATTLEWTAPSPPPHGISPRRRSCIAAPTNTACRAARRISRCKTNRCARAIAKPTKPRPPFTIKPHDSRHGNSLHSHRPARYRALERQDRHLAFPRLRSHALRRALLRLRFPAARRASGALAARLAERAGRHDEHRDPDRFVGHGGDGLGVAQDAAVRPATRFTWGSRSSAASSSSR